MIKCNSKAFVQCQIKCHHCKTMDEACFLEGSDCDRFNQKVLAAPKTNADRIRAMSDEELAELLGGMCKIAEQCDDCPLDGKCPGGSYDCGSWNEWLKQPAEEE